jgi:hypothetical protein
MKIEKSEKQIICNHRHGSTILATLHGSSLHICAKLHGWRTADMVVADNYDVAFCMINAATSELVSYFAAEDSAEARASAIFERLADACCGDQ